nr:uncharacterized protein LOC104106550 isoform X2 [Nicotiana tomentosiformis]
MGQIHSYAQAKNWIYTSKRNAYYCSFQDTVHFIAGRRVPPSFLRVSGAALPLQRELLWFKEVEKIVPPSLHRMRNNDGKTPRQFFTEEHQLLLKEGERLMKDTVNSCMIVATLIATMVFAAGFTVPGGNNDDEGHARSVGIKDW